MLAAPVGGATAQLAGGLEADAARETLLAVSVNGSPAGEPVVLLRAPDGRIFATAQQIAAWRLKLQRPPAFSRGGTSYILISGVPGIDLAIEEATQSLAIVADPALLTATRLGHAAAEPAEALAGGKGGFLNYDAFGQLASGSLSGGGAVEVGAFAGKGAGLAGFVGRWTGQRAELVRLDTNWTIDDPARMRSLRLGDSISRGGVGGVPMRFAGVQLARNFAVEPGFVTIPLPSLRGSAALPSVADIYVDGALRGRRDLPPGPFEITDVPIISGSGDVQLVVRDLLGRQVLHSQSYYSAPALLRRGLHDYSYEVGVLRRAFGSRSNDYGSLMASATHRLGISDTATGELHAEASRNVQSAGAAASLIVANAAHLGLSLAGSRSRRGQGLLAGVSLERRSRGLSAGLRAELTTSNYMALGWSERRRPPASQVQAFAGLPLGFGSLGLSYLRRDGRGEPDAQYVSANGSIRLGRFANLHLAVRKSLAGTGGVAGEALVTMPLGRGRSASAGASLSRGRLAMKSAFQKGLPVGEGFGYQFAASSGTTDRLDARLSYQSGLGSHEAQFSWADGQSGVRLATAGGIGLVGGTAFASRQLSDSFATVTVGPYADVRVYADNQLIGRTDARGRIVVPRLRSFETNRLRFDASDLPLDALVSDEERTVRPRHRHGVAVDFAVRPANAAIVRVLRDDGSPIPAGSSVTLAGGAEEFISAPGGEVYLTGLAARNRLVASWSDGRCEGLLRFAASTDPQPHLGNLRCRSAGR